MKNQSAEVDFFNVNPENGERKKGEDQSGGVTLSYI